MAFKPYKPTPLHHFYGARLTRNYLSFSSFFHVKFDLEKYVRATFSFDEKEEMIEVIFGVSGDFELKRNTDYNARINTRLSNVMPIGRYEVVESKKYETKLVVRLKRIV